MKKRREKIPSKVLSGKSVENTLGKVRAKFLWQNSFSLILLAAIALFWLGTALTYGDGLDSYFFFYNGGHFFGNDYFLPLSLVRGDPWEEGLNYPAGAIILLKALCHMLPADFDMVNSYSSLQTYLNSVMGYVMFMMVCLMIFLGYFMKVETQKNADKFIFSCALLLSGPIIYNWECGNIVFLAIAFIYIFLLLYNSDNKYFRLLAYLALGIATALKVYPAVFSLMVLSRSNKKEFIVCAVIVLVITVAPFFYFDGIETIKIFFLNFFSESEMKADWGLGYNYSFQNLCKMVSMFLGVYIEGSIPLWSKLIPMGITLFIFFISKEEWQKLFALSLLCVWFPDYSYGYMLPLFIPALCALFKSPDAKSHKVYSVAFLLILIPYALPRLDSVNTYIAGISETMIYPLAYGHIIINASLVFLVGVCLFDCGRRLYRFVAKPNLEINDIPFGDEKVFKAKHGKGSRGGAL